MYSLIPFIYLQTYLINYLIYLFVYLLLETYLLT